jgi:hypothetical protein
MGLIATTKEEIKLRKEGFNQIIKNKSHFSIEPITFFCNFNKIC